MTTQSISRKKQKIHTFGCPHHGLNVNGTLTLSNGDTIYKSIDGSKRRYGDCYQIEVPGHTYADPVTFPSHLKFDSYALSSGFEYKSLYNTKIGYGDKKSFIYCDTNKDRWKVTINPAVGGTATAITLTLTLRKFGDFVNTDDEFYTYTLNVGNPAISTALNGYVYEVVNVSKTGNLAIIGLCLENSTTESQSTCIFDRQYGYPLAFIRLDLTDKNTQTASIYRSKTYCERKSTIPNTAADCYIFYAYTSACVEKIKNPATKAVIRTTITFGQYKDYRLRINNTNTYTKETLAFLPDNTTSDSLDVSWSWTAVPGSGTGSFSYYAGNKPYHPIWNKSSQFRVIHVFIDDNNNLVDVECAYITESTKWSMAFTSDTSECMNISGVYSIMDRIMAGITDNRVIVSGDITSNTGECIIDLQPYGYVTSGSTITYNLLIGGKTVDSVSFNSRTLSSEPSFYVSTPTSGTKITNIPASIPLDPDNSYIGPSSGNITAVPLTSYKNYKGWMSKGTYTIDGTKYVTPYIQLYTNNLVGMIEGNGLTSNPDNAHWDTGSCGNHIAMKIFNKNGVVVSSGGTIDALSRYCSWQPKTGEFSGLYNVPVCYV